MAQTAPDLVVIPKKSWGACPQTPPSMASAFDTCPYGLTTF